MSALFEILTVDDAALFGADVGAIFAICEAAGWAGRFGDPISALGEVVVWNAEKGGVP